MVTLTNPRNPHIKQARQLQQRKVRDETGLFVVEGIRHVGEAASAGAQIEYLCYAPELLKSPFARGLVDEQAARGRPCYALATDIFRSIAEKDNPQGLLAVVRRPAFTLAALSPARQPWQVSVMALNSGPHLPSTQVARFSGRTPSQFKIVQAFSGSSSAVVQAGSPPPASLVVTSR